MAVLRRAIRVPAGRATAFGQYPLLLSISDVRWHAGGSAGSSIRNVLAGGVAYREANPSVTAVAVRKRADLKIVSDNVLTAAEFVWAENSVKSIRDFKDGKIGYQSALDQPIAGDSLSLSRRAAWWPRA